VFDSVGFALEDYSALRYLQAQAQTLHLGDPLALMAQLTDPKDLYQLVRPVTPPRHVMAARGTVKVAA
jgi:ornithine cyclodeaminase